MYKNHYIAKVILGLASFDVSMRALQINNRDEAIL